MGNVKWTQERQDALREIWGTMPRSEIAPRFGVTVSAIEKQAQKMRIRSVAAQPGYETNHKPFTPRCGEILRKHGVRI